MHPDCATLQRQRENIKDSLRLIARRKTEYVSPTDVPLQLLRDEVERQRELDELERKIAALGCDTSDPTPSSPAPTPTPALPNPFIAGPVVPPEQFYGREQERRMIRDRIGAASPQSISLVGLRRSGKSSLLNYIEQRIGEFCTPAQQPLILALDLQDQRYHTPLGIIEGVRRGIAAKTGTPPWQREENDDAYAVSDGLELLRDTGRRLIVLLDEFEQIGSRLDAFQGWAEDWRAKSTHSLLTLVLSSMHPISEIYQSVGLTSPFGNDLLTCYLGPLAQPAWQQLVQDGFAPTGTPLTAADLAWLADYAGGMPFYVQLAATALWLYDRDHSRAAAWFRQQAEPHFAELWRKRTPAEQAALRYAAGQPGYAAPQPALLQRFRDYGVLRPAETGAGLLFSRAFADYVRGQLQ